MALLADENGRSRHKARATAKNSQKVVVSNDKEAQSPSSCF